MICEIRNSPAHLRTERAAKPPVVTGYSHTPLCQRGGYCSFLSCFLLVCGSRDRSVCLDNLNNHHQAVHIWCLIKSLVPQDQEHAPSSGIFRARYTTKRQRCINLQSILQRLERYEFISTGMPWDV